MLTEQQQHELAALASMGCDRQTGCHYVGCTAGELLRTLHARPEFAARLLRSEASAEVTHMRCVHDAVKEGKQWRASVWWLERRAPDRFARKPTASLTTDELQAAIEQLTAAIAEEIADPLLRQRVKDRLQQIAAELTHAFDLPTPGQTNDVGLAAVADDSLDPDDEPTAWQA
ncbi:MAG: hypothetical protein KDA44_18765 [Planctomycetales bacterium]|nr:hypothetical protein [Planctomycetales bacterium]